MVEYTEAIKKPFTDLTTLGIGAVIAAIPLVNLLVSGYGAATAQDVFKRRNKLREWKLEDLPDYVIKLVFMLIIQLVYILIPMIIIVAGIGATIATAITTAMNNVGDPSTIPTAIINSIMPSLTAGGPIILIGGLLLLVALFLAPIAIVRWIKKDKLGAAFEIGAVVKNALTADYIISILVILIYSLILGIVAGLISGILALIPIIGWIVSLVIMGGVIFVLTTTQYTILAQVVKD